ncbi:hypothetical protein [Aliikangiella sp. IMCC44359]|uniref:hypothetical protein n=1 Tax=Aliikangiella sp. IMCC44359 TaxID=3459125 RepID=UPI00403A7FE9
MKNKIIIFISFVAIFLISALLIKNNHSEITPKELDNLSLVVNQVFQSRAQQSNSAPLANSKSNSQSIMAVIYKKPDTTWFIKAKGLTAKIDQQSATFSQLFLTELKFDNNQQPDFSHIPESYRSQSSQTMRVATFNLNGLEVSVTKLTGSQNIPANIARWRNQLSLPKDAPEFVKYQDNNQTILVRLDQSTSTSKPNNTPQPPQKENLQDFLSVTLSDNWQQLDDSSGMASGKFQLNDQGELYEVAVLRLPASVPLETILGIWKERAKIPLDTVIPTVEFNSKHQQTWQLIAMNNQQFDLLVAVNKGPNKYTFLRISNGKQLTETAKSEFKKLLDNIKVTKS